MRQLAHCNTLFDFAASLPFALSTTDRPALKSDLEIFSSDVFIVRMHDKSRQLLWCSGQEGIAGKLMGSGSRLHIDDRKSLDFIVRQVGEKRFLEFVLAPFLVGGFDSLDEVALARKNGFVLRWIETSDDPLDRIGRFIVDLHVNFRHLDDGESDAGVGRNDHQVLDLHIGVKRLEHLGGVLGRLRLRIESFVRTHDGTNGRVNQEHGQRVIYGWRRHHRVLSVGNKLT